MEFKNLIRFGIGIMVVLMFYYGYKAQKAFEEAAKPAPTYLLKHKQQLRYRFDADGNMYPTQDDRRTRYLDDPALMIETDIPKPNDWESTSIFEEDLLAREAYERKKKMLDRQVDEFKLQKERVYDAYDAGEAPLADEEDAYGGEVPSRW